MRSVELERGAELFMDCAFVRRHSDEHRLRPSRAGSGWGRVAAGWLCAPLAQQLGPVIERQRGWRQCDTMATIMAVEQAANATNNSPAPLTDCAHVSSWRAASQLKEIELVRAPI